MVQIHPSLPLKNTDSSRVLVARNPSQIVTVRLQPESHWRFHRILCGFVGLVLHTQYVRVNMFQEWPTPDQSNFLVHVPVSDGTRRFLR